MSAMQPFDPNASLQSFAPADRNRGLAAAAGAALGGAAGSALGESTKQKDLFAIVGGAVGAILGVLLRESLASDAQTVLDATDAK